jgi:hypothetical protein
MFKGNKTVLAIAILALIVAIIGVWPSGAGNSEFAMATPGTQLPIEQYVPSVLYNGGIYSALPIQTTSDITGVTITGTSLVGTTQTIGSATGGTAVSKIVAPANCTVIANANTIAASSTKDVDCAVTGLRAGDTVNVIATTSMSTTFLGVKILASRASTTNDYATFTLSNETGTTFTWTGAASTSLKAFGIR